ncbi:glycoside hydrolase family 3 N-terminal domain-containing protein [Oscillibacter sp.]|jgi:beta-N-acetylhexosaminidase|uniref:glycoside hydrolase family 3 N-terminal domain-containing protein n=1 Tax=Oscillibacter sp. TaxID=1945593 RepID=UPI002631CD25|nr:glycoside hydrolase family 3 N-terminal domain-containing protein [Oscillibacter sp.]
MRRTFAAALAALLLLSACAAPPAPEEDPLPPVPPAEELPQEPPAPLEPTEEELAADRVEALLSSMTLEEKVGQLFFVRCPEVSALEDVAACRLGGYLLFGRDFKDSAGAYLTAEQVTEKIQSYQDAALIPLLIGVDEEGGSVARASWNPNLFPGGKCRSPQWLLNHRGGEGDVFAKDAWEKSTALLGCGVNVNLAPVCDVSMDPGSFIYDRTLGLDAAAQADYAESVVSAMAESGIGSVLKHFPGYGDNADTHTGIALDERPMEAFLEGDFLPFRAGLAAGGRTTAVLVSHNIVSCMDPDLPASLSPAVHEILRQELDFDGVVMTDDLAMKAVADYAKDGAVAVMALAAGNDLLITGDYRSQIPKVLEAVENGALSETVVDGACRRVLAWKQALGLIHIGVATLSQ